MSSNSEYMECLKILAGECENSKEFRMNVENLLKLHRNIHANPENDKYCHVNIGSKLMQNLMKFEGANLFLTRVGWQREDNFINYVNGIEQLQPALQALQDIRLISPEAKEWTQGNKVEDLTKHVVREEKMRAEAAKVRDEELKQFYADQKERKELAEKIKRQIKDDVEARKQKLN